ncbi:helix-turn-helix domain-containing protein [Vibrio parahaemolyticus]|uniref:helix-turn-helix domain-containing protein n=1 Tax=Vibrio parahaemolyticus TaxID=670 RepID=UPI0003DCF015|nr:helix-turn-helix domain-containing protein [Vibrio parahaemolyticus]EGR2301927.1 DNA-binding protein [Vibrio parahaemolyticus]EHH1259833.1 helix-turn-helix domain-containing protein [Vibrio parahaemolyticus]EHZ2592536.1 helix-turn-helix domain-containing protein [Vibrio parahaemolyticus]EIV1707544.1 helix-turn-helix domain-containing protein [Vibrio parahaemolyticus]EJO3863222.1 helix-turn-helix domain-containing protein [Vibrio parahaemolyticus]
MNKYLTSKQLADLLQLTESTLANQRSQGRGIPFVKVEKAVRYRVSDIEAYLSKEESVSVKTDTQGKSAGGCNEF